MNLREYKRVRLPQPRVLPGSIAKILQQRTGNPQLTCVPQDTEYGWFCACGAFHPNEEAAQVCSECGGDRAYIKASLTSILEEARQAAERQQQELNAVANAAAPAPRNTAAATAAAAQAAIASEEDDVVDEPTAQFNPSADATNAEMARVRQYAPNGRLFEDDAEDEEGTRMFDTDEDEDEYDDEPSVRRRGRYADDDEESEDDVMAERIIRWAPPITAVVCALIVAVSLIYYFVIA